MTGGRNDRVITAFFALGDMRYACGDRKDTLASQFVTVSAPLSILRARIGASGDGRGLSVERPPSTVVDRRLSLSTGAT